jgi:hypothetical protein
MEYVVNQVKFVVDHHLHVRILVIAVIIKFVHQVNAAEAEIVLLAANQLKNVVMARVLTIMLAAAVAVLHRFAVVVFARLL